MASSPKTSYDVAGTPQPYEGDQPPQPKGKWATIKGLYMGVPGVLTGAILGIIIGWAVQTTDPSDVLTSWIGILGTLFIRAIKCLVAPLVFCSLVVGMADMLAVGKAGKIGSRAFYMYLITTIVASIEGLIWVIIFRPLFSDKEEVQTDDTPKFSFECQEDGYFLSNDNGTISCVFDEAYNSTGTHADESIFYVTDINGVFEEAEAEYTERSLTDALQGQLEALVPSNITEAFYEASLLSIIMFAIPFGIAISKLPSDMTIVADFFREINAVFMKMIQWVIVTTPIALISLLAETVAEQDDLKILVTDVSAFVGCSIIGMMVHLWIIYPILLFSFVRINPYKYLRHIVPAQVFALSCASSMATLPLTMRCVDSTKQVSKTLSRFVLSLGATINMDGAAICYPIAVVFMAEAQGLGYLIGNVEYFLIIVVSTLGAIGAGPIPAASIVMTMTVWTSVFSDVALPASFSFIVATDWLLDRFSTCTNISGDTIISRIVAKWVGEDKLEEEEEDGMESVLGRLSSRYGSMKEAIEGSRKESTKEGV